MREQLGRILAAHVPLDPVRGVLVPLRPPSPWDLRVRDVPHQNMAERKLELFLDRRAPLAAHELLALERAKSLIERGRVASAVDQRAPPEHLADHGGVLKQLLLDAGQRIEARGDETLKRARQLKLRAVAGLTLLDYHPCKLLGVQEH